VPAVGHSAKNTVTAPESAELHKITDIEKTKRKVLMEKIV